MREDLTFSFDGFFTGAYRDIPLAQDVTAGDVEVSEGGTRLRAGRRTRRSAAATLPGTFGAVRLPQGLRIVWHYQQDGGQRTFTLRYRLRGVVIAHDDAVEVAPQVWGNQWKFGLRAADGERARRRRAARHARLDRAGLARPPPDACARGEVLTAVDDVPAQRSVIAARALPAFGARAGAPYARHVHDDILPATIAREQAAADRAARDKRELEDTLHHPWAWILAAVAPRDRPGRRCSPASATGASGASIRPGRRAEVRARAARRPGARARAVAARAARRRRRRPDGRDALRARAPRALQDDARHARGVVARSACATRRSTTSTSRAATRASS